MNTTPKAEFDLPPSISIEAEQQTRDAISQADAERDDLIEARFRKEFEESPADTNERSQSNGAGGPRSLGRPRRPLNGEHRPQREFE